MLSVALKEWNLVISDLLAGRQVILLRKGGILEANNEFELDYKRFLFYPTFIHQDPRMVKPERRGDIQSRTTEPTEVEIPGYGEVAKIFEVPSRPHMDQLRDMHLWDEPFIDMRFNYRAEKPLYLVVVRAFKFDTPVTIENTLSYAGCKSWVPLEQKIEIENAHPALPEETFTALLARIQKTFSTPL